MEVIVETLGVLNYIEICWSVSEEDRSWVGDICKQKVYYEGSKEWVKIEVGNLRYVNKKNKLGQVKNRDMFKLKTVYL